MASETADYKKDRDVPSLVQYAAASSTSTPSTASTAADATADVTADASSWMDGEGPRRSAKVEV